VIFPQFADQGPGPRHGLARTRRWQLVQQDRGPQDALATLRLLSDADTRAAWPYDFALELTVRIQGQELETELAVENTGDRTLHFQAALHSYWRVADSGRISIEGLQDRPYRDAASGASGVQHSRCLELLPGRAIDRIVGGPARPVVLSDLEGGQSLWIASDALPDVVVWNPGPHHALADLPAEDWQRFVCVESGAIESPVELPAAETWAVRQRVQASA
jgi:glucose-6-phosphate 1-epimerase